jgi:Serine carboxypeptidase
MTPSIRHVYLTCLLASALTLAQTASQYEFTKTKEDYRVTGLEQVVPAFDTFDGSMYAGLIPTTPLHEPPSNATGELMFWMFEPRAPIYDDTLTVWMNGGPGCSSMGGCLFEHGPVTIALYPAGYFGIDPDVPLGENKYSWVRATRMLYVEQPHGTGFSTGPFPKNETEVARDFYHFIQHFYQVFPEHRARKLFFMGESYAGMYVPSIAHYIYHENVRLHETGEINTAVDMARRHSTHDAKTQGVSQASLASDRHPLFINLAGIALGNGWIDARVQGPAVIDYAWWHGMIDSQTKIALHRQWDICQQGLDTNKPSPLLGPPFHPFTTPDECGILGAVLKAAGAGLVNWGGPNAYDISTWDPYTMLDKEDGAMAAFYNNPKVQGE